MAGPCDQDHNHGVYPRKNLDGILTNTVLFVERNVDIDEDKIMGWFMFSQIMIAHVNYGLFLSISNLT